MPEPRPMILMATLDDPVENDAIAVILAWLPGALQTGPAPLCQQAAQAFQMCQFPMPAELGRAVAEISATFAFSNLMARPGDAWGFGTSEAQLFDCAQTTPLGKPRWRAHPDEMADAFGAWARQRLDSFVLVQERSFYQQMEQDPQAIESRLLQELRAQREALDLASACQGPAPARPKAL